MPRARRGSIPLLSARLIGELAEKGEDLFSTLSLALNIAQTCFLAWLAVYARRNS